MKSRMALQIGMTTETVKKEWNRHLEAESNYWINIRL